MSASASAANPKLIKFKKILHQWNIKSGCFNQEETVFSIKLTHRSNHYNYDELLTEIKTVQRLFPQHNTVIDGILVPHHAIHRTINGCDLDRTFLFMYSIDLSKMECINSQAIDTKKELYAPLESGEVLSTHQQLSFFPPPGASYSSEQQDDVLQPGGTSTQ